MAIHDHEWNQPGIEHLDQVLVFQFFRGQLDVYRGPFFSGKLRIERYQALVVTGGLAHENVFA
ncbi:hypothetical protein D3C78_1603610 [compost metagenome]